MAPWNGPNQTQSHCSAAGEGNRRHASQTPRCISSWPPLARRICESIAGSPERPPTKLRGRVDSRPHHSDASVYTSDES